MSDDKLYQGPDAVFRIPKPVTGAYFWRPPLRGGILDLRQIGL